MIRQILQLCAAAVLLSGCVHQPLCSSQTPYRQPLVSPGLKFLTLPSAVQNTIRAEAGTAEIHNIERYAMPGNGNYYQIDFLRAAVYPPLYVAADGSVLNPDLTIALPAPVEDYAAMAGHAGTLTIADLPAQVVNTIKATAKSLEISHIVETTAEDRRVYDVHFKGQDKSSPLRVDQDGKIVDGAALPGAARKSAF